MRLKGLSKIQTIAERIQATITKRIDDLDQSAPDWEYRDDRLNEVWEELDRIVDSVLEIKTI